MKVKELQKTVNIAWSPLPLSTIYLAAGSAAQQFDSNGNSALEIYSTNLSDPSFDLELKASLSSQYRFQKIIWSPTGHESAHPNGLLVGGCEGGHVLIYSAAKMLAGEDGLIARQDKHTGTVTGLDFNTFQTNLLASVASESEIFIWDLNNTSTHMNPGTKTQPLEDVQNVAWNRQVQHILASVFSSRCVIWDLRKSEQIIKLSDTQSRVRWHGIQWHPDIATQVWLASEDDQAPIVQLWDLRYATAPAKTMQIHQRGVLGMSWCPRDSDLMVSCGKDNRIFCWNPNTEEAEGEILSEVATTATWYSDVQWCPRNPALIASSSLDGNVSIYSLFGGTQQQVQTSNKIADSFPGMDQFAQAPIPQQSTQIVYHDLKRAPKWMKRPLGVSFGFGGKLVEFNGKSKAVNMYTVITEPELVERANALEQSLNESNFAEYCRIRADQMPDQNGRYLWYFIKANFESNPKEEMLNLLGYNKEDIEHKFSKYIKQEQTQNNVDQLTKRISTLTHQPLEKSDINDGFADVQKSDNEIKTSLPFKIPCGEHPDSLITEALLTGNLEVAVELCMETNRNCEALIIASKGGIEFLINTQKRYLKNQNSELSQVISALVTRDWMNFVCQCTVDSWKEALVAVLKHSDRKVVDLCERLGDRLLSEPKNSIENTRNAILCFICAGSVDKIVVAWYQLKQLEQNDTNYNLKTLELQDLAEVVMLVVKSLEQQGIALEFDGKFADFISNYGRLLTSQGALTAALVYIFALGPSDNPSIDELRERIYNTVNFKSSSNQTQQTRSTQPTAYVANQSQQQQRGSFSNQPQGYSAQPISNQFQTNNWNPIPAVVSPQPTGGIFNPIPAPSVATLNTLPAKPSYVNDQLTNQPSRPQSASSQGGLASRSKYVLDPSVGASGNSNIMGSYGSAYNPNGNATMLSSNPNSFNGANSMGGIGPHQMSQAQPSILQPAPISSPFTTPSYVQQPVGLSSNFIPGVPPIETIPQQSHLNQQRNIQRNPTPPPGWNDPPALKSSRPQKKLDPPSMTAPITHPIFGTDSNQNQNSYMDPNSQYQNTPMPGMPPPPTSNMMNQLPQNSSMSTRSNFNPVAMQNNNPTQFTQQTNFHTSVIPANNQMMQNICQPEQPAAIHRQMELPKEKPPLPEEFIYMQTVFEELKNQCLAAASDPRTKRKFVDVAKRLENLYDTLRDNRLAAATIAALNQIVQYIQIGDYANALQVHTSIAFGSDFSQCAGFMPGLKVLMQSASDLQVYLR